MLQAIWTYHKSSEAELPLRIGDVVCLMESSEGLYGRTMIKCLSVKIKGHSMSNQPRSSLDLSDFFQILGNDWDPWEMARNENIFALGLLISEIHANELWANWNTHISETIAPRELVLV